MSFSECVAVALIGIWMIVAPPRAFGAELTRLQARDILYVAYGQYHGPRSLLDDPPTIHLSSQEMLRERFNCHEHCPPIAALYDEETSQIYLLDTLDFSAVFATTVLLHEFIHHFQAKTKGRVMDLKLSKEDACLEIVEREREAYRIQWDVLIKAGDFTHAQAVRFAAGMVRCQ